MLRGVRRGHLLRVLADSLPPGTVTFGNRVTNLVQAGQSTTAKDDLYICS